MAMTWSVWRRLWHGALTLAVLFSASRTQCAEPYDLGGRKFLLIDNTLIASLSHARQVSNPPVPRGLSLIAEEPWEAQGLTSYGNVLHDPVTGEDRLYYVGVSGTEPKNLTFRVCMAVSRDGSAWEKPKLGAIEFAGSTDNNIVIEGQREGTVVLDPNAPVERRYIYLSSHPKLRLRLFTSPDGVHFTTDSTQIAQVNSDSQISTFWDDQLGKFVHYFRLEESEKGWRDQPQHTLPKDFPYPQNEVLRRTVARAMSTRPEEPWNQPYHVVLARDPGDPPAMDFYTNAAQKYAGAPDTYLMFPTPYYQYNAPFRNYLNAPTLAIGGKTNDGTIETQLAVSRDGVEWTRYRSPYLPLFRWEGIDFKVVMMYPGMLERDGVLQQYAACYAFTHGDTQARFRLKGRGLGGIFRFDQRRDGFVSVDFDYAGGELITTPFTFKGTHLRLNVNTSAAGELRTALLDPSGAELPGFGLADCQIINGDYLDQAVTWQASAESPLKALEGKPVVLKIAARSTKLYALQFTHN